jgi:heme-degrading monooxygenase HmoA
MVQFAEMDEKVTLFEQMEDRGGPVVLINRFNVRPDEADKLVAAWAADAAVMQRQPGYISTQLHRGIGGSCVFLNYAVWESAAHFKKAFNNPEFQNQLGHYPSSAIASPHLFRKVAVAGICVG